jgi:hypothetical protein
MARTLILNISETGQTLPAVYGGFLVTIGHGRVVSDETSVAVGELGGFAAMDGKWVVYPVSTDTLEGDFDVAANGVAMLATFVPGGGGGGGPVDWSAILNKPSFSDVATSGSYDDLTDTPAQFSGAYGDLTGTPSIPSASNTAATDVGSSGSAGVQSSFSRADHQHSHGTQAGGSLHAAATTVSAGFMSAADKTKLDGLENFSGDYNDLTNTPSPFSGSYTDLTDKPSLFDGAYGSLTGKPDLFDGAYGSLTGTPTFAAVATSGSASDLSNQPYDIVGDASGSLAVGKEIATIIAPRALVLTALQQSAAPKAQVVVKIGSTPASYPQSVAAGAVLTIVVTTAGDGAAYAITGRIA